MFFPIRVHFLTKLLFENLSRDRNRMLDLLFYVCIGLHMRAVNEYDFR